VEIRELGPGDEALLARLDVDDPPRAALAPAAAALRRALSERFAGREAYVLVEGANARARAFYAAMGLAEPGNRVLEYDGWLNDPGAGDVP
jgi:hypothetical protein